MKNETTQKQRQLLMAVLFRQAIFSDPKITHKYKKISEIYYCGSSRGYYLSMNKSHKRLSYANFCNERLCPICGRRKAYKARIKLKTIFDYLNNHYCYQNGNPRYIPIFLTLTIPNVPDNPRTFKDTYQKLHYRFRKMMNYKEFCGFVKGRKGAIQGGVSKIEVTYNHKADTFHIHLHALLLVHRSYFTSRYYIKHNQWQSAWEHVNHWNAKKMGHHLEIRVERPYYKDKDGIKHKVIGNNKAQFLGSEREAITEVTGYETKSDEFTRMIDKDCDTGIKFIENNLSQAQRAFNTAYFGTKNQAMYTSFGLMKKVGKMYNSCKLDDYKPQDNNVYGYNMKAKYQAKPKKYATKITKMTKEEMKQAEEKGIRTPLSSPKPKNPITKGNFAYDRLMYLNQHPKERNLISENTYIKLFIEATRPAKAGLRRSK